MNKLSKIFLGVIILVLIIVVIILLSNKETDQKDSYDVSTMKEVTVTDILRMFEDKKTYVVYIGWKDCDICLELLPALKTAQIELNYITQYLNIEKVDMSSEDWKLLVKKLSMQTTQTITEDGQGEPVTESYGYFLNEYGFTPTVIIIKNGKQTGGFIGNKSTDALIDWLKEKI